MRETSDLYKALLADPAHVKEIRLTISGTVYGESQIVSLSTSEPLFAEDTLSAGGAVAREIDFVAFLSDFTPRRAQIIPEVRLVLGDQVSEWLQKGVFYIDTRSKDPLTGVTTVHGFDAMLMGEQEWIPADTDVFPMPMKEAVEKTAAILGIELDPRNAYKTGDAYMVDYPAADGSAPEDQQAKGLTIRQVWRWIAGAMGGNFIINDLGQLRLVPLNALPGNKGYLVTDTGSPITFGGTRILVGSVADGNGSAVVAGDKVFVGQKSESASVIPAMQPVSKIILKVDDTYAYVSDSDTDGLALEISCAYGSQQIADDLLIQLKGYAYQPMEADDALIDPAAELGDGVTAGGVYTILAQKDTTWDMLCAAHISAPGSAELESEYGFTPAPDAEYRYELAQTRSLIAKTSEQIRLEVAGVDGRVASLTTSLGGIEGRVEGVEGEFAAFLLDTDAFYVMDESGNRTAIRGSSIDVSTLNVQNINFSGVISFDDLTGTDDLLEDVDKALGYADDALKAAEDVEDVVSGWTYGGTTKIDGREIKTGTVTASILQGGEVQLLTSKERQAGGLSITGATSASYAVELYSNGALRLCAYGDSRPSVYLEAGGGAALGIQYVKDLKKYNVTVNCGLMPNEDGAFECGNSQYRWADVYSLNEVCQTSDANRKHDIEDLPEKYVAMFDLLRPKRFKLNEGTSGRYHPGYSAQDVKAAMDAAQIDSMEFGGWVKDCDKDGKEILMLRYGEFDAIRDAKIKQLDRRLKKLEGLYEVQ